MNKVLLYLAIFLMTCCAPERIGECYESPGALAEETLSLPPFQNIVVQRGVQLFISQSNSPSVRIEAGANIMKNIDAHVTDGTLYLYNNKICDFIGDREFAKAYVAVPNLIKIRNSSQHAVTSLDTLKFPNLELITEDYVDKDAYNAGDFNIIIDNSSLIINTNGIGTYTLSGKTKLLDLRISAGLSLVEASKLHAKSVKVFHRGANDLRVFPLDSIQGKLVSTGNLVIYHRPKFIDVDANYTGKIFFE